MGLSAFWTAEVAHLGLQIKLNNINMIVLLQRVSSAHIRDQGVSKQVIASIERGLLLLVGFEQADSLVQIEQMAMKLKNLRVFSDEKGKINLAGAQVGAQYLLVSQFTLYADCKYGNRPSFHRAAPKAQAKTQYEHFISNCERLMGKELVQHGPFGASLDVELINDGPVTLWLNSKEVL